MKKTNLAAMKPHLIGIAGRAEHGKDTIGAILSEHGYERKAFADKVRELALAIDPVVELNYLPATWNGYRLSEVFRDHGWDEAKKHHDVRRLLQSIGDGGRQVLGQWVWVDALFANVDTWHYHYVITDVRYPNEVTAVHSNGGVVWYVDRPGYDNGLQPHASEELDPTLCDAVIVNDGSVEDLRRKVEAMIRD